MDKLLKKIDEVLPFHIGNVIFFVEGDRICGGIIEAVNIRFTNRSESEEWYSGNVVRIRLSNGGIMEFSMDSFNKDWFVDLN